MTILNGTAVAEEIFSELKNRIKNASRKPGLAVILVGNNPASQIYVKTKSKKAMELGMEFYLIHLPENSTKMLIIQEILKLNVNPEIDGILLQLPLPQHLNPEEIIESVDPFKDVDGLHPINLGKLLAGYKDGFTPCTPLGVIRLMTAYNISPQGKHVVILGRSNIVGKPLAALLMQKNSNANATVTLVHSRSKNIKDHLKQADILVAAIGSPLFIKQNMIKEKSVIIDVGINRLDAPWTEKGYQIVGDTDFNNLVSKCSAISPVPKGVGPLTIAMLMENTWLSYSKKSLCS
ncbi:MAG: bifunctional 5,10-methylenetetrahydrofolate dehydrogenase/5,10-methenyltetrahydrofolate cyclohydrolase [Victivallaceae bacterium]